MPEPVKVHDDGFVHLVDWMPRENLDEAIVQSARVSYADGTTKSRNTEGLIRFLLRHWHTTPFEMVTFKFHIKMPIFVARQHMRHRTASINEMSARYSIVPEEYYEPDRYRGQHAVNRQASSEPIDLSEHLAVRVVQVKEDAFDVYRDMLAEGCSREMARCHLPQSTYTEFYWQMNMHNLMHFLHLRLEEGAQKEIRDYAQAIYDLVAPLAPLCFRAFADFRVNAVQLTGPEIRNLRDGTPIEGKGETAEWAAKRKLLGV